VLVAGESAEAPALYLAANGCDVTAVTEELDVLRRVMSAAAEAGLGERVHACHADLTTWIPDAELHAVIVMGAALKGLSAIERGRVIEALKGATAFGGVHVVQTNAGGRATPSVSELATRYAGWTVSVERAQDESMKTFLARKEVS
jgi:NAD(P)-dependent dehydrogenase (short-subunit alcohol dehydrogenase family)